MSVRPGWLSSVLLVVAANLIPLAGWWWNRTGEPEAAVDLSESEAMVIRGGEDNSSVRLSLQMGEPWLRGLDSADLVAVGFDADLLATGEMLPLPPRRPARRPAWILLRVGVPVPVADTGWEGLRSRLHPVAVGKSPGELYRRSGDRGGHIVMRGIVRLHRMPVAADSTTGTPERETWFASVDMVTPSTLHVPKSLVSVLDRLAPSDRPGVAPRYQVRLSMGRLQMPRVTGMFPATGEGAGTVISK